MVLTSFSAKFMHSKYMCPCKPFMLLIWLQERSSIYNDTLYYSGTLCVCDPTWRNWSPSIFSIFCILFPLYKRQMSRLTVLTTAIPTRFSSLIGKQYRLVMHSILLFDRSRCVKWVRFCNPDISVIWLAVNSVKFKWQVDTNTCTQIHVHLATSWNG